MEIIIWIVIVIGGFLLGTFGFSQIIYTFFVAWPKAKKFERDGKLVKPIPLSYFVVAPVIWGALIVISVWITNSFLSNYSLVYYIVLGVTLIIVVAQIPLKNKNLEADIKETWKRFLKTEE